MMPYPYTSEEEQNMIVTCLFCEDAKAEVHVKHHDDGIVGFISN
jgi:hypothetical protein